MTVTLCLLMMVGLLVVGVPFWVTMGLGTVAILVSTDALQIGRAHV